MREGPKPSEKRGGEPQGGGCVRGVGRERVLRLSATRSHGRDTEGSAEPSSRRSRGAGARAQPRWRHPHRRARRHVRAERGVGERGRGGRGARTAGTAAAWSRARTAGPGHRAMKCEGDRARRRGRPGGRRAGRRAGQVQRAEEGQRRGAEGRGRGAEGAGDGLLLAHPRASVGRLAKPLAALPPALPLLLASEARLVRARHAAPSGAARAAAHSRPPQLARSVSSPQPTAIGCRRSRLPVRARTQHSTLPPLSTRSANVSIGWR